MDEVDGSLMTLSTDSEKKPLIINDSESVHHHSSILIAPAKFNCGHQLPLISVIFILVASAPALLVGCTVGFPSAALLALIYKSWKQGHSTSLTLFSQMHCVSSS